MKFIITCEHGGNKIPEKYRPLFKNKKQVLNSHHAWDPGALILAKKIAHKLSAPLFYSTKSRLLIDLNRSLHHRHLFSEYINPSDATLKRDLIDTIYFPYRSEIESCIKTFKSATVPVVHFSIHSFTRNLNGIERNADIGLLYDPSRINEKSFCTKLKSSIEYVMPNIIVRNNYPYRGNADGFTTYLRKFFNEKDYLGIEIEINQKHILNKTKVWVMIQNYLGSLIKDETI